MAKKEITDSQTDLFASDTAGRRTSYRRRALVLQSLLREESAKKIHEGRDQDHGHEIIIKWADLELGGHLRVKETARDAELLDEVFGQALGYKMPTACPEAYHIERQFSVASMSRT